MFVPFCLIPVITLINVLLQAYILQLLMTPRSLLRIDLSLIPDFRWEEKYHGSSETFMIIVKDVDGEMVLFHDSFVLHQRYAEDEHRDTDCPDA
jgi:hypothetical protein